MTEDMKDLQDWLESRRAAAREKKTANEASLCSTKEWESNMGERRVICNIFG